MTHNLARFHLTTWQKFPRSGAGRAQNPQGQRGTKEKNHHRRAGAGRHKKADTKHRTPSPRTALPCGKKIPTRAGGLFPVRGRALLPRHVGAPHGWRNTLQQIKGKHKTLSCGVGRWGLRAAGHKWKKIPTGGRVRGRHKKADTKHCTLSSPARLCRAGKKSLSSPPPRAKPSLLRKGGQCARRNVGSSRNNRDTTQQTKVKYKKSSRERGAQRGTKEKNHHRRAGANTPHSCTSSPISCGVAGRWGRCIARRVPAPPPAQAQKPLLPFRVGALLARGREQKNARRGASGVWGSRGGRGAPASRWRESRIISLVLFRSLQSHRCKLSSRCSRPVPVCLFRHRLPSRCAFLPLRRRRLLHRQPR